MCGCLGGGVVCTGRKRQNGSKIETKLPFFSDYLLRMLSIRINRIRSGISKLTPPTLPRRWGAEGVTENPEKVTGLTLQPPESHSTYCRCESWGCRSRQGHHPLCILHGGVSSAALLLPGWILHGPLSRVIGMPSMCTLPQPANANLTDSNFVKEAEDNSKFCWIESLSKVKNI